MNIVIDTNVVISGTFFGGAPRQVLEAVVDRQVNAYASAEIIGGYQQIVEEMIRRKQGRLSPSVLTPFIQSLHMIETTSHVETSRDGDDDKFIECAIDSRSLYIVSGDKDLLVLERYEDIEIITASEFCKRFLL